MHVLYFVIGLISLALALGWRPSLDSARSIVTGAWAGIKALASGPWMVRPPIVASAPAAGGFVPIAPASGLLAVLEHYAKLAMALVGAILLVLSITLGASVASGVASGLSPHDALDKAIRAFQVSVGLPADGLFGRATVKAYYGR